MIEVKYVGAYTCSQAHVRFAIKRLMEDGFSSHSKAGLLLAPLMNHLISKKIPFQLTHYPDGGSHLKLLRPIEDILLEDQKT